MKPLIAFFFGLLSISVVLMGVLWLGKWIADMAGIWGVIPYLCFLGTLPVALGIFIGDGRKLP